jgi:hypothetical protein
MRDYIYALSVKNTTHKLSPDTWEQLQALTRRTPSARAAAIGCDLLLALLQKHHGRDLTAAATVAATAEPGGDL